MMIPDQGADSRQTPNLLMQFFKRLGQVTIFMFGLPATTSCLVKFAGNIVMIVV